MNIKISTSVGRDISGVTRDMYSHKNQYQYW